MSCRRGDGKTQRRRNVENDDLIAATATLLWDQLLLYVVMNAYWEPLELELPPLTWAYAPWRRCIDTFLASPEDVCPLADGPLVLPPMYRVEPRSLVILFAQARTDTLHAPRRPKETSHDRC
jgi:isoamylase